MLPRLVRVSQNIPAVEIKDISKELSNVLQKIKMREMGLTGARVGITAGSRGIRNISRILKLLVEAVKEAGGDPVIVPAMGSHGGATEEGQSKILASLGILKETMGAPVLSCVDAELIGLSSSGIPVYCNKKALELDKLIVVNRIKPHTDFNGGIESGICKMLVVGLGSHQGAITFHSYSLVKGHESVVTELAELMIRRLPVAFALGIVENWKGQTAKLEVLLPKEMIEKERILLAQVKADSAKLPFKWIDVLLVGEIGKNISGTGMDTKVIGRITGGGQGEPKYPKVKRIVVLGLTPESHGNATGIGLADFMTNQVYKAIDIVSTTINSVCSMVPEQGRLPCVLENDRSAIDSALKTLGPIEPKNVRLVYLKNTAQLKVFYVSEAMLEEVRANKQLNVMGELEELKFDYQGKLYDADW